MKIRRGPATVNGEKSASYATVPRIPGWEGERMLPKPGNLAGLQDTFPEVRESPDKSPRLPDSELGIFVVRKFFMCAIFLALAGNSLSCRKGLSQDKDLASSPRIVSLAPNLTEIVFALSMGDHLAGVTDFCDYPPEARTKPRLGGLKNISLEAVLAKNPDIIFATKDGNDLTLIAELQRFGLKVEAYQPRTIDEVLDTILGIGKELGRQNQAEQLVAHLRDQGRFVVNSVAGAKPVSVLLAYQREPLILAGPGTFADDLIKKAGGINIAADAKIPYPIYSMEIVIAKRPEFILDVSMSEPDSVDKAREQFWSRWPDIPAVKNGKVAVMNPDLINRPGPRLFTGLIQMAEILHPERFKVKK